MVAVKSDIRERNCGHFSEYMTQYMDMKTAKGTLEYNLRKKSSIRGGMVSLFCTVICYWYALKTGLAEVSLHIKT